MTDQERAEELAKKGAATLLLAGFTAESQAVAEVLAALQELREELEDAKIQLAQAFREVAEARHKRRALQRQIEAVRP